MHSWERRHGMDVIQKHATEERAYAGRRLTQGRVSASESLLGRC